MAETAAQKRARLKREREKNAKLLDGGPSRPKKATAKKATPKRPSREPARPSATPVARARAPRGGELIFGDSTWGVSDDLFNQNPMVRVREEQKQRGTWNMPKGGHIPTYTGFHKETLQNTLKAFDSMPPEERDALMLQLVLTGFDTRTTKKIRWGSADPVSRKAYGKAVEAAFRTKRTVAEVLNAVEPSPENLDMVSGGSGSTPKANVIQHANPNDIQASALSGFQAALGRGPTPQESQAFLAGWSRNETALQSVDTSGGGTFNVTELGNAEEMAKTSATRANPQQARQFKELQVFKTMLGALGVD